jgi:hypothetical protein
MHIVSETFEPYFSTVRRNDLPVIFETEPMTGQRVIGYMIHERPNGIVTKPKPSKLSGIGWLSVAVLGFLFWPVMCVPCCCSGFYEGYQVPVFE